MEPKHAFESTPQAEDEKQVGPAPWTNVPSSGGHIPVQDVSISPAAVPHKASYLPAEVDIRRSVAIHVSLATDEVFDANISTNGRDLGLDAMHTLLARAAGHSFGSAPTMNPTVIDHAAASFAARPGGRAASAVGSSAPAVAGCSASRS